MDGLIRKSPDLLAFEATWITLDWAVLTATQKQAHIAEHYRLQVESAKYFEAKRIESESQAEADRITRRNQAITYLTNKGFACDNSLADWQLLYNHPKVFGANWNEQAIYQNSLGRDLDYFLQTAYNFWVEYVKNE